MFKHRQILKWDVALVVLVISIFLTIILIVGQVYKLLFQDQIFSLNEQSNPTIPSVPDQTLSITPPAGSGVSSLSSGLGSEAHTPQFFSPREIEHHQVLDTSQRLIPDLSTVPIETFSIIDSISPKDMIQQLTFGLPGGGGCNNFVQSPEIYTLVNPVYLGGSINTIDVGWKIGQIITIELIFPTSNSLTTEKYINENDKVEASGRSPCSPYNYRTSWNDPLGMYEITMRGEDSTISTTVQVVTPVESTLFETDNGILLFGFLPNKLVRLFLYEYGGEGNLNTLISWQEFEVGETGTLGIIVPNQYLTSDFAYIALSDHSERAFSNNFVPAISGWQKYNIVIGEIEQPSIIFRLGFDFSDSIPTEVLISSQFFVRGSIYYDESTETKWLPVIAENGEAGWVEESKVHVVGIAGTLPQP